MVITEQVRDFMGAIFHLSHFNTTRYKKRKLNMSNQWNPGQPCPKCGKRNFSRQYFKPRTQLGSTNPCDLGPDIFVCDNCEWKTSDPIVNKEPPKKDP
jgi:hypothetical protein